MHSIATLDAIATAPDYCDRPISYYNTYMPLLTDSRIYSERLQGHRYFMELISTDWEVQDSYPIPKRYEKVDVVVTEPSRKAIEQLIAATGWLTGFEIVSYWQPEDGCEF